VAAFPKGRRIPVLQPCGGVETDSCRLLQNAALRIGSLLCFGECPRKYFTCHRTVDNPRFALGDISTGLAQEPRRSSCARAMWTGKNPAARAGRGICAVALPCGGPQRGPQRL